MVSTTSTLSSFQEMQSSHTCNLYILRYKEKLVFKMNLKTYSHSYCPLRNVKIVCGHTKAAHHTDHMGVSKKVFFPTAGLPYCFSRHRCMLLNSSIQKTLTHQCFTPFNSHSNTLLERPKANIKATTLSEGRLPSSHPIPVQRKSHCSLQDSLRPQ